VPDPESFGSAGLLTGRVERSGDRTEVFLAGELDLAAVGPLHRRITGLAEDAPGEMCLDLAELEFLGSTGIRMLIDLARELGTRLVVRNVGGMPRRALEMTQTIDMLRVEGEPASPGTGSV
jgi:anti-anti-sigma factor